MNAFKIRPMVLADVDAVAALTTAFAHYMRKLGDTTELKLDAAALELEGFGSRPAFEGLVVELQNEVVGFLLYHDGFDTDEAMRLLFVVDLFVHDHARKSGIGSALMHEASRIARERGAGQLVWTVDKTNIGAVRFYERMGGQIVDRFHLMVLDV